MVSDYDLNQSNIVYISNIFFRKWHLQEIIVILIFCLNFPVSTMSLICFYSLPSFSPVTLEKMFLKSVYRN